ncbi:MAG: guanylate kinase [Firmicutes bacterium]|nr:guanylate kinase [Bacillota bacterium]MBR2593820.1 guanylate kinase [Bacillota bacterium]
MDSRGVLLIISGPSGSGKGTVAEILTREDDYFLSVSATTRAPRDYEIPGEHYYFMTKEEFLSKVRDGEFLEWAEFCGNCYGTPKKEIMERLDKGQNIILEIEVQGALQVKNEYPEAVLVFMIPPSAQELKKRLAGRGTETEEVILERLERALIELDVANMYDYLVINHVSDQTAEDLKGIVMAEKQKVSRNKEIIQEFKGEVF